MINYFKQNRSYYEIKRVERTKGIEGVLYSNEMGINKENIEKALKEEGYLSKIHITPIANEYMKVLECQPALNEKHINILKLAGYGLTKIEKSKAKKLEEYIESPKERENRQIAELIFGN